MYAANDDVARMIARLASVGAITDRKVEAVAMANHKAMPMAGTPIPWADRSEEYRDAKRALARQALLEARP